MRSTSRSSRSCGDDAEHAGGLPPALPSVRFSAYGPHAMNATAVAAVVAQAAPLVACLTILLLLRRRPGLAAGVAIASLVAATVATAFLVAQVAVPNTSSVSQAVWLP